MAQRKRDTDRIVVGIGSFIAMTLLFLAAGALLWVTLWTWSEVFEMVAEALL